MDRGQLELLIDLAEACVGPERENDGWEAGREAIAAAKELLVGFPTEDEIDEFPRIPLKN